MAISKKISIDIYESGSLANEDIMHRHAFHVVIIYEHKMMSFLQKINKRQKLFTSAFNYLKSQKETTDSNIVKYESLTGNVTIRFPYKNSKRPLENEVYNASLQDIVDIMTRVIDNNGKITWVKDYDEDLVRDNREFSKRLGVFYEKQHIEDKMLEILELGGRQVLTEAEINKARYELGEKEFERRLRENIPINVN